MYYRQQAGGARGAANEKSALLALLERPHTRQLFLFERTLLFCKPEQPASDSANETPGATRANQLPSQPTYRFKHSLEACYFISDNTLNYMYIYVKYL